MKTPEEVALEDAALAAAKVIPARFDYPMSMRYWREVAQQVRTVLVKAGWPADDGDAVLDDLFELFEWLRAQRSDEADVHAGKVLEAMAAIRSRQPREVAIPTVESDAGER